MLIIAIVKSSLALSLGLVGALSIVRFRAAIKEPEELAFLFLAIAIGLGFGADQAIITLIAFVIIAAIIIARKRFTGKMGHNQNLFLTVYSEKPQKIELEQIVETLKSHCTDLNLKRFDESQNQLEASFLVEFRDFEQLKATKKALQDINESIKISFLDNKGVV